MADRDWVGWEDCPVGEEEPCMKSGLALSGSISHSIMGQVAFEDQGWKYSGAGEDLILLEVLSYSFDCF